LTKATLPNAVETPDQGTSYNPVYEAHQDLLRNAHEREVKRVAEAEQAEEVRRRMEAARGAGGSGVEGMLVDVDGEFEEEFDGGDEDMLEPLKLPGRKTGQQRRKAARVVAEVGSKLILSGFNRLTELSETNPS
jgi:nucleolar protein 53